MIRLLEDKDIKYIFDKYNIDKDYLNSLLGNMNHYMYISINNEIDGYMICFNDGNNISINEIIYNKNNINQFIKHLIFNSNKDIIINTEDEELIEKIKPFGFELVNNLYKKRLEMLKPNNISFYEYYEQDEEFRKELLNQINEPLWPGTKYLYNKICNNELDGKVYVLYDEDRKHIISFASLSNYDEIRNTSIKPWIGCVYTFRIYRGNRFSEKLIKNILKEAKSIGNEFVYLSSDNEGMYEKFGFDLYDKMETIGGNITQVFIYDTKKLDNKKL